MGCIVLPLSPNQLSCRDRFSVLCSVQRKDIARGVGLRRGPERDGAEARARAHPRRSHDPGSGRYNDTMRELTFDTRTTQAAVDTRKVRLHVVIAPRRTTMLGFPAVKVFLLTCSKLHPRATPFHMQWNTSA